MSFLDDLATLLIGAGVGVAGSSLFLGSAAIIPQGSGPYTSVIETGGVAPTRIHNKTSAATQRPTAQILTRAENYADALSTVRAAYNALDGIFNTTINGTFYLKIGAKQEPTDMSEDGSGRTQLVFNVEAEKQPS